RARDLRAVEPRTPEPRDDAELHGLRRRLHQPALSRHPVGKPSMIVYLILGTIFGFILSRSGAADYNYIQGMFLFERFQLYGIIGTAVALTAPGLWILKRFGRTVSGRPIEIELKPLHRGNIAGGLLFGVGWSMAG